MAKANQSNQKTKKRKKSTKIKGLPSWFTDKRIWSSIIVAFSFLLYGNTLFHDYTLDDAIVIYDNMYTKKGVSGIPDLFRYDTFKGFFKKEGKDRLVAGGRYRPLTPAMFALEWELFAAEKTSDSGQVEEKGNPFVGHFLNIVWYALTGIVLFLLLLQIFQKLPKADQFFLAGATTLLFLAHPAHTEAVANIKGRDEIITMLGSLAALYFVLKSLKGNSALRLALAALLFFLGLLSKENAITFLAVIPLTLVLFSKATLPKIAAITGVFAGTALLFLLVRASVLGWDLGDAPMELMNNPFIKIEGNTYVPFSNSEKLATILFTLGKYLLLLVFPHPLTHDYYPRHIDMMQFSDWRVILSLIIHVALITWAILSWKKNRVLAYCIGFYVITISIVSNLVFPVGTNMSERFIYIPSLAFCLALTYLLYQNFLRKRKTPWSQFNQIRLPGLILILVLLGYTGKTMQRNAVWKDNYTLFLTDVKTSKNSAKLRNSAGGELIAKAYETEEKGLKNKMLKDAVEHLNEALRIHPNYKNAYLLLGNGLNYLEDYEASITAYRSALRISPDYTEARSNLGITLRQAGRYYGEKKGDLAKSINYLEESFAINPKDYETARLLGVAYGISQDVERAVNYFAKALEIKPNDAGANWDLGNAFHHAGDQVKADEYHRKALAIDPEITKKRSGPQ